MAQWSRLDIRVVRPLAAERDADMPRKSKGIPGLSFSWKRAVGLSGAKGKLSRQLGVPLTRSGRRRKAGAMMGCAISAWALALAVMVALIVACASAPAAPTTSSPPTASSVPWRDYSPAVKTRIDSAAANKDCAAFQSKRTMPMRATPPHGAGRTTITPSL